MNMSKKFDKRKKVVYDLICDDLYTPMKFKELAMLLRVAKEMCIRDRATSFKHVSPAGAAVGLPLSDTLAKIYWVRCV